MAASNQLIRAITGALLDALTRRRRPTTQTSRRAAGPAKTAARAAATPASTADYPGDFRGQTELSYDPHPGNTADPGEVVWTWVPYEEDHSQGKDRPVLIIGRDGPWLLAVPMTSQDHDRDAAQEAAEGRYWVEIGSGEWDSQHRVSEVRVNRILRIDPERVRRISARISPERFEQVAAGIRRHW